MGSLFARSPEEELAAQRDRLRDSRRALVREQRLASLGADDALAKARWAARDGNARETRDLLRTHVQRQRHVERYRAMTRDLDELAAAASIQTTQLGMQHTLTRMQAALARAEELLSARDFVAKARRYTQDTVLLQTRQEAANDAAGAADADIDIDLSDEVDALADRLRLDRGAAAASGARTPAARGAAALSVDDMLAEI